MTDNGTAAGFRNGKGFNAAMRGTKGSEYDGGHRVPCFIRWPAGGWSRGRSVDRLTAHIDLLPTLIEACRLTGPAGVKCDGASIVPLLAGDDDNWPDRVLVTDSQRIERPEKWRKSAVMTERWRLVNGEELYDIQAEPGQRRDLADGRPAVVQRLRRAYDAWWTDVSERFDEYCRIVLGSERENPSRLTCHDWHGSGATPWNQTHILRGTEGNGFWAVEVARAGEYVFSLRRWPREVDAPIGAAIPGGRAISASRARLKIGPVEREKPIPAGAEEVAFRVPLTPGDMQLQTWLTADDGTSRGAYYVYVERIS
jgi:arylsulfatase B